MLEIKITVLDLQVHLVRLALLGRGLFLDADANPDFAGKRLTEVGECSDDDDVVNKSFLEDQLVCVRLAQLVRSLITNQKVQGSTPILVEG